MKNLFFQKRLMYKIFFSTMTFLWIFFLCSSTFAAWDNFSQPDLQEKKDISVFIDRLSERLQSVFEEIVTLSSDQKLLVLKSDLKVEDSKTMVDISNHLYVDEILSLAELGVIDSNREKFYPENYVRRYEFVIMMVKHRLAKSKTQLSPIVFPLRGRFFDVAQNTSYAPYVAYAEQQWLISQLIVDKDGQKLFLPNQFLTKVEICELLRLDKSNLFCSSEFIKRWEFAAVLFRWFSDFQKDKTMFLEDDIQNSETKQTFPLISQFKTLLSFVKSQ